MARGDKPVRDGIGCAIIILAFTACVIALRMMAI